MTLIVLITIFYRRDERSDEIKFGQFIKCNETTKSTRQVKHISKDVI
jgi:hypothetical protein